MDERFKEHGSALLELGRYLQASGYGFTTATPATHVLVNARAGNQLANSLPGVFGWSRPFELHLLSEPVAKLARASGIIVPHEGVWRSRVRFSTLGAQLYAHSAFPTDEADAVFFGPDTYRFARLLKDVSRDWNLPARVRIVDIGCGSGAGGIYLSRLLRPRCDVDLVLGDINPRALRFSRINAAINDCSAWVTSSDVLESVDGQADIIIANPPYLVDAAKRLYRHGGGEFGGDLSVRIVEQSMARLRPDGRLVLYTGSPIIDGADTFLRAVKPVLERAGGAFSYEEIDPDVFGEELIEAPYERVERIAVVALSVRLQGRASHASR